MKCGSEQDQLAVLAELDRHGLDTKTICAGFAKTEPKELAEPPKIEAAGRIIRRAVDIQRRDLRRAPLETVRVAQSYSFKFDGLTRAGGRSSHTITI